MTPRYSFFTLICGRETTQVEMVLLVRTGCSPCCHFLLASYIFPVFFTQRASRAAFTSSTSHSLNSSSVFSSPLTSPPPHLTVLRLCSSFSPAAGLGHPVWAVDFFTLRLFSSSVLLSFSVSVRSYPALSHSPVLPSPFPIFYPSCFYFLRQTRNVRH